VLRGGSWNDTAYYCRSASRDWGDPRYPIYFNGFRVVAVPPSKIK
jgi:formylglycine-generating enzyme required for sulfatase activity